MHMFSLGHIIYMPLSPSTTLLGPISTDFPTISLYNTSLLNNSFTTAKFEHNTLQKTLPQRFKRIRDDVQQKKRPKLTSTINNNESSSTLSKNALMSLHELKPSIEYKLVAQTGPSHRPMFTMAVEVNGQIFEGMAQTKKEAKQAAAEKALRSFSDSSENIQSNLLDSHENQTLSHLNQLNEDNASIENDSLPYSHRDLADRIALCIQEKFIQLTKNDVRLQRRRVLSGVVLTHNYNLGSIEIICITTGTRCIHNDRLICNGRALNDCHAEIIARRCLIRYCYEQLQILVDGKSDQSIFERILDTDRFRLKSSIHFHLYISSPPCGDSRLFSLQEIPSEKSSSSVDLKHSLRKSRGLLRTKIEVGEGTIPVLARTIYQNQQSWDETLAGKRLFTMSCSDKICRWNFIGLQGALLSILIDPIYYTSIIIGSLCDNEHIQRALFARIEQRMNHIPTPYGLRQPFILSISNPEIRNTTRAPNHAFLWNCVDKKCEIIDTLSGLTISRESSMVSKAALFEQWKILMKRIKSETIPSIYYDAKQLAVNYQTAKMEVNQAFQNSGFGLWIKKPHEQDEFDLSSSESNEFIPSI